MAIDSHTHINSLVLDNPTQEIHRINQDNPLINVINVSLDIPTTIESITISEQHSKFYSTAGIHPLYVDNQNLEELIKLANHNKVVAIGEIGLDSSKQNYQKQLEYLVQQILIANELKLPVIIHANNSNQEVVKVFRTIVKPKYGCVFHCFQPDIETMKYLIDNSYYISFAGRITYKNAKKSLEISRLIPKELFLVETDSPYISPEPFRNKINSSTNLPAIIRKIAELRNENYEEIEKQTEQNTKRLFKRIK